MAGAVEAIQTLFELGMASTDRFRVTAVQPSAAGEHSADCELVLGGGHTTGAPIRWQTTRIWKAQVVVAECIRSLA